MAVGEGTPWPRASVAVADGVTVMPGAVGVELPRPGVCVGTPGVLVAVGLSVVVGETVGVGVGVGLGLGVGAVAGGAGGLSRLTPVGGGGVIVARARAAGGGGMGAPPPKRGPVDLAGRRPLAVVPWTAPAQSEQSAPRQAATQ